MWACVCDTTAQLRAGALWLYSGLYDHFAPLCLFDFFAGVNVPVCVWMFLEGRSRVIDRGTARTCCRFRV